jgi:putative FmdB family regulatory protein
MAIYEFRCKKCGQIQEIYCRIGDDNAKHIPCINCGICVWEKVPAVSNFVLSENFKRNMP